MREVIVFEEQVSSKWTTVLFMALAILFGGAAYLKFSATGVNFLFWFFIFLTALFLFYTVNYLTLEIQITPTFLKLKFGVFLWRISMDYIAGCRLDDIHGLMRYGGGGIHFMMIQGRYRASLNFLEYSRVLLTLKNKIGLVQDISFSTRRPDEIIAIIQTHIS
jgi:hypothetical protein